MNLDTLRWLIGLLYVGSIILGNFFILWFGLVHIGPVIVPAGAIWIGLTLSFRDLTQRFWGHEVWFFMIGATIITGFFSKDLALASMLAFLAGESTDWLVYTLSKKSLKWRIVVSNLFSSPIDSAIFVTLAFGWMPEVILTQAAVKYLSGLLLLPFLPLFDRFYGRMRYLYSQIK